MIISIHVCIVLAGSDNGVQNCYVISTVAKTIAQAGTNALHLIVIAKLRELQCMRGEGLLRGHGHIPNFKSSPTKTEPNEHF